MFSGIVQFFRDVTAVKPPLFMALESKDKKWSRRLIEQGADVNEVYGGKTPLMVAIENFTDEQARLKIVRLLLEEGARPSLSPENSGSNAFIAAGHYPDILALFTGGVPPKQSSQQKSEIKQLVV